MINKKYSNYMKKRELVLEKMEMLNIDKLILNDLKEMKLNTKNKDIIYIKNMIKKVVFDYEMYGKAKTIQMIENYDYHIYSGTDILSDEEILKIKEKINKSIDKIKLPFNDVDDEEFKTFILKSANNIENQINNKDSKKLSLQC